MKLCIIGPESRSDTEIELMDKAKAKFDSVLYTPIEMIRIETIKDNAAPFFKSVNLLDFDAIFIRVEKKNSDFCYVLLKIFEQHGIFTSLGSDSLLYGYNEFLLPFILKNNKIQTPKTYLAMSRTAIENNIETMIYPVLLKLPYSKTGTIVLDSADSAKGVVDTLEVLKQPVTLQETFEDAEILSVLVVGNDTFAIKGKNKKYKLTRDETDMAMRTSKLLKAAICQINLIKTNNQVMVAGFNIKPRLETYSKVHDIDILAKCLSYLAKHAAIKKENPVFNKFLEWIRDMRWKADE